MRKLNTIIVLIIMILIIDHIIFGSMHFLGTGASVIKPLAMIMFLLVLIHAVISMIITIRAEKVGFKTKARYNKENRQFWLRRASGMAIVILAFIHAYSMVKNEKGIPNITRMPKALRFSTPLLILSVGIHLLGNIRPLLISLGIRKLDRYEKIIKVLVILITLFAMVANIIYIINMIKRGR